MITKKMPSTAPIKNQRDRQGKLISYVSLLKSNAMNTLRHSNRSKSTKFSFFMYWTFLFSIFMFIALAPQANGAVNISSQNINDNLYATKLDTFNSAFGWKITSPSDGTVEQMCCNGSYGFVLVGVSQGKAKIAFENITDGGKIQPINEQIREIKNNSAQLDNFTYLGTRPVTLRNLPAAEIGYVYKPQFCVSSSTGLDRYCKSSSGDNNSLVYEMDILNSSPVKISYFSEDPQSFLTSVDMAELIINSSILK